MGERNSTEYWSHLWTDIKDCFVHVEMCPDEVRRDLVFVGKYEVVESSRGDFEVPLGHNVFADISISCVKIEHGKFLAIAKLWWKKNIVHSK